ncbi:MAG: sodium:solute symporter family protein [Bacillota bacterium]|jgi:SSS family solute:Na+ symporter|nr:sodium:solute symporter family protein [Bacillota bacterium]
MSQNVIALLVIGFFMVFPLVIGFAAKSKSRATAEDYFIQSRAMGGIAVFFSVAATWWSAFAFLGSNGYFYSTGPMYWTAIAWNILFGVMYFGVGKKIWYMGKLNNYVTATDFFNHQYGSVKLGNFVAIILIVCTIPYLQIQLSGGAYLIQVASGELIPFALAAMLFYIVIIIYVWAGGIRAIAWCDIFYGVLLFFGMVFAGFYVASLVGGPAAMFHQVEEMFPGHTILAEGRWMNWLAMFIITPVGSFMGPQLWARFYSVKSARTFDIMPFLLAFAAIAYIGSMLTGNAGKVLYPDVTQLVNSNADYILPTVLFNYAPFVVGSVLMACGAAAAMSTANAQVLAISTVYTMDIHRKYINKNMTEHQLIWVGRWALLILSAVAYIMCLYVPGLLVTIGLVALGGTAQVMIPTCGALFWKRSTVAGAMSGLIVGLGLLVIFTFTPVNPPGPFASGGGALLALICNLIVFVVVSCLSKPRPEKLMNQLKQQYADFYHQVNMYE